MRFLSFVFLLFGAAFVKSALTGSPPVENGISAPVGSSESKWDQFTSFIGEEVVMAAKDKMMKKATCCLKMNPPADIGKSHIKCLVSSTKITMDSLSSGTFKTPTTSDWKRWYENFFDCLVKDLNVPTTATGYDTAAFKQIFVVEDWVSKEEDKTALRSILDSCVDMSTSGGPTAFLQLLSLQKCMMANMSSLCMERGEPVGMMMKVGKAFLTLWDESQCSGVQIPPKLDETIKVCMTKANAKWQAEGLAKFTSTSMMKYNNSDVKNAMYFLKTYGKNVLMYLLECGSEEMGFYNETTGLFNYTAGKEFFSGLTGWNNPQVMNSIVMAFQECEVPQNETALAKMDEMEKDISIFKTMMKFKKCYMNKFVDICGLNNDLAQVFLPILNNDLVGAVGKDFSEKKGFLAVMHLVPALKEKFSDFFSAMNMSMMAPPQ